MVKDDPENITYKALKEQFDKMSIKSKEEKSKSVGESITLKSNVNTISSISTKINSKEDINKNVDYFNLNKINNSIMESCDSVYEVEELNTNYFSTLLDFEKSNLNYKYFDTQENKNLYNKESGTIVIQEFLKNLSQKNIENKTDIVKLFEEFLKQREEWPRFSNNDIIKLFIGNTKENNNLIVNKKRSFNFEGIPKLSGGNKNKGENKSEIFINYLSQLDEENLEENKPADNSVYKGLFHYIGEFEINILLSISCLAFLVKLLDNEFNPEVELYLKLFKSRRITDYQLMRLEDIIKYNKGGVQSANNAIKLLSILTEDKSKEYITRFFIKDENILNKLKYK